MFHFLTAKKMEDVFEFKDNGISLKGIEGDHFGFTPIYYFFSVLNAIAPDGEQWGLLTADQSGFSLTDVLKTRFKIPDKVYVETGFTFPDKVIDFSPYDISYVDEWIPTLLINEQETQIYSSTRNALQDMLTGKDRLTVQVDGCISPSTVVRTMWFLSQIVPYSADYKTKIQVYFTDLSYLPLQLSEKLVNADEMGWYPHHEFIPHYEMHDLRHSRPDVRPDIVISDNISLYMSNDDYIQYLEKMGDQVNDNPCVIFERHRWFPNGRNSPPPSQMFPSQMAEVRTIQEYLENELGRTGYTADQLEAALLDAFKPWYVDGFLPRDAPRSYDVLTKKIVEPSTQRFMYATTDTRKRPDLKIFIYNLQMCNL